MIFELVQDISASLAAMPAGPRRRVLALLGEALRRDAHHVDRNPTTLFQCLWNTCSWHDGELAALATAWRSKREHERPGLVWLRSRRPPRELLGSGLQTVLRGHDGKINAVAFSPDGRVVATASDDHTVRLWSAADGLELLRLGGAQRPVTAVAFSPDGRSLAGADQDGAVRLWDTTSGAEMRCFTVGSRTSADALAFVPDGPSLICGYYEGVIRVWDSRAGRERVIGDPRTLGPINSCAVSSDGHTVLTHSGDWDSPIEVRLWELKTGRDLGALRAPSGATRPAVFGPCAFGTGGQRVLALLNDNTLREWDVRRQRELRIVAKVRPGSNGLAVSRDGLRAAMTSRDGLLTVWDIATGAEISRASGATGGPTFSLDGRFVAALSGSAVMVWEVAALSRGTSRPHSAYTRAVALAPDGTQILHASGDFDEPSDLELLDASSGECVATLWSHDGLEAQGVATAHAVLGSVIDCAWSPDGGQILAVGGIGYGPIQGELRFWDVRSAAETRRFLGHDNWATSCAYSPDGRWIAVGFEDGTTKLWETNDLPAGDPAEWERRDRPVMPARLTLPCTEKRGIRGVSACAFSPDGRRLITSSHGQVKAWDARTGQFRKAMFVGPGDEPVSDVGFSPDGRWLVLSTNLDEYRSWEGNVRRGGVYVLDAVTGRERFNLARPDAGFLRWAITPDASRLIAAGRDGTTLVIDVEEGRVLACFAGDAGPTAVAIGRGGEHIAIGDARGWVSLLELVGRATGPAWTTAVRHFRPAVSRWDDAPLARCAACGVTFPPPAEVNAALAEIAGESVVGIYISDKAWDDSRLLSDCPTCSHPVRFNPFVVDLAD